MQMRPQPGSPEERTAPVPLGNHDIYEDENTLVNRLYYAVPDFTGGRFRCTFFYEENTFRKEANGDLTLVRSEPGKGNPRNVEFPANQ